MLKKITLAFYFIALTLLILGCKSKVEQNPQVINSENSSIETNKFDENYRPQWWEKLSNEEYLHSYAFLDGSDQEKIKVEAINSAQAKFLHYQKSFVVNLTEMILEESGAKDKFKSNKINAKSNLIYSKDYSRYLKRVETDFIQKDDSEYRCFVAVGLPLAEIQKEFVIQFQKDPDIATAFASSKTYLHLLKQAGLTATKKDKITEQKVTKKEIITSKVKYEEDFIPAWFKVSYNNMKIMVNQIAIANNESTSIENAIALCKKAKMKIANDFARTEAEKYRKVSGYDEIKFNKLKNDISAEIQKNNYPITKEFIKTIHIGENSYKTYAQYSINKKSVQNSMIKVLKSDDVLYSRLRASMAFDELEDDDF